MLDGLMPVRLVLMAMYTNILIILYLLMSVFLIVRVIVMLETNRTVRFAKKDTFWTMMLFAIP